MRAKLIAALVVLVVGSSLRTMASGSASNSIAAVEAPPPYFQASGFSYVRPVVIDHREVSNTDQTDFPVLISTTLADLATVANGGKVQSASGYDIVFTSDLAGQTRLDHEIDSYNPVTGAVGFWVRIPTLSHTADTTIFMWYGNSGVTASQENKAGVWRNGYAGVWHLSTNAGSVNTSDSTGHGNNGTNSGATTTTGQMGGAANFNGSSWINITTTGSLTGTFTIEAWAKPTGWNSFGEAGIFGSRTPQDTSFDAKLTASKLHGDIGTGSSWLTTSADGGLATNLNTWHHGVYVVTTSGYSIYADGLLVGSGTYSGTPLLYDANHTLAIGTSGYSGDTFNGTIDETRLSTVARSADWIATEYNNQNSPSSFFQVCAATAAGSQPPACSIQAPISSYSFFRQIVIDHTRVPNTDQTDFPFLISTTLPDLATVGNGGKVQNSNGYDIVFTADAAGQTRLDHEIDSYDPTTGTAAFWVRIPLLSHTADTAIYMWYGSSAVIESQENKVGVWRNGYAAVWHLGTGATATATDSTGVNSGVLVNVPAARAAKIGGAASFPGAANSYIDIPGNSQVKPTAALTLEAWVNPTQVGNSNQIFNLDYRADGSWNSPWVSYALQSVNASQIEFSVTGASGSIVRLDSAKTVPLSQWTHLVGTYDGTTLRLYENGAPDSVTASTTGPISYGTSKDLTLGSDTRYQTSAVNPWNGLLDEMRVSSLARSADWIATEFNNQSSPSTSSVACPAVAVGSQPPSCSFSALAILGINPSSGPPGIAVTISGVAFGAGPGSVSFNGAAALINSWSNTTIVATVPLAATTGPLVVTTSSQATAQASFTVAPAAGLTAVDVGNVSAANSVSLSNGVYTVTTHGSDIGGTSDSATFLYQKWSGDFDVLARVTSQQNSGAAAKAGLMVRETLDPGARNVLAFLTPTQGAGLAWRLTPGASETITTGASTAQPSYWIRLIRRGNNFAALGSPDGQQWFALGSQAVFMAGTVYIGIAQTSNNAASNTASYDNYAAKSSALPSPWVEEDIGSPATPGVSVFDGTSFFVDATGQDLASTVDPGAHFIYQPWTGDFDLKVHAAYQQNASSSAKIGLTARDSASNANVAAWITPAGSEGMSWRASPGASTSQINGAASAKAPNWVRLIRRGNNFSMYVSQDGANWQLQVAKTVNLGSSVYLGAVGTTSTSSGVLGTASVLDTLQVVAPTAPAGVQSPWSEGDIGNVSSAGNSSFDGLSTVVLSGGYDIYYPPDSFHFIYQSMSGDFDAAARFTYVENTDPNAKIGLMVRSSLDPSATYFGTVDTSTNGAWPSWRYPTNPGTAAENGPASTATRPYWVRLVRRGNTFWSYGSTNGTSWTLLATQNIAMTSPVYLGVTASVHITSSPGNSAFDGLSIRSTSLTAVPKVVSVSPPTAGPLVQLTVQGSGFGITTGTVQINGVPAAVATWNDSTITITAPQPAPTGAVVVTVADGTQSNSDVVFTGINPVVAAVSPASGLPGDKVTISGSGFGAQQASLAFNGLAAPVLNWQNNQVVAYVPPSAQTGPVVITQSGVASNNNVVFTVLASQPTNGVAYGYDPLARLTSVVDTSSNSGAIYSYDAVGNILSITRTSTTSPVSILSFNPSSGAPSSEVTIVGANFSSTASQNTASFNGAAATVFRSTPTTLLVSVPAGATSGPIRVTAPGGSATSTSTFTVKSSGPAPVITGFNPAIVNTTMNVAITITGANFDPVAANNHATVGNMQLTPTAATTTSLTVLTPAGMVIAAAPINLQTSNGSTSSASNLFVVPGDVSPANVAYVARVSPSSTTTFSIPVSYQTAVLIFDGIAGHNLAMNLQSPNFSGLPSIGFYMYGNTRLVGAGSPPFMEWVLPITSTYALVVTPGATAGTATVQMFDSTNLTGPVPADGTSFTITTTIPGQSGTFKFSTPLFSHLFCNETATTFAGCNMTINNPDGSTKSSMSCSTISSNDLGEVNEGPFTLSVVPTGMNTGSVTMNLVDIPDVSGTITINGASVNLTTTTPKQYGYVTFSGAASQGVTLKISSNITAAGTWFALQHLPDLANVYSSTVYSGSPISQSVTLPSAGNYRVVVAPGGSATGTLTITLTSP